MLASSLIACNLGRSPWRVNMVLVLLLFLVGGLCSATCANVM
jgi:hypothetical protein